jgi:hypothetical protein
VVVSCYRYFYDAVRPGDAGARVKVEVGVVDARRQRTFLVRKLLDRGGESDIVDVTMERPLGISFERDTEGRAGAYTRSHFRSTSAYFAPFRST